MGDRKPKQEVRFQPIAPLSVFGIVKTDMHLWKLGRIRIFGVMGVIFVTSMLVTAQSKHSKMKTSSVEGSPAITALYRAYSSYEDAFLTITIQDSRGIDSLEMTNLNSGEAIVVNTLKDEPLCRFSETYNLHDIFASARSSRSTKVKIAAKNTSGQVNSLNVTLHFR
jgi:hypothetical protein